MRTIAANAWPSIACAVLSLGMSTCGGKAAAHTNLDASMDAIRSVFQADSGKVRAIFLASPT